MTLSTSDWVTLGVGLLGSITSYGLAKRDSRNKRDAQDKMVADLIDRLESNHQQQVRWYQSQLRFFQGWGGHDGARGPDSGERADKAGDPGEGH